MNEKIDKNRRFWLFRDGELDFTTDNEKTFVSVLKDGGIGLDNGKDGNESWVKYNNQRGFYDPYEMTTELDGGGHSLLACQVKS